MTQVPDAFWIIAAAMLGAIFGSYVNMASHRLPRGISTWKRSRSFCPKCQHQLAWFDNIPILSYVFLRGRCHYCRAPYGPRYLYTELVTSALFALCAFQYFTLNGGYGGRMSVALLCVELFLVVDLVLLSVVDLEVWLIPIETTLWWIPLAFLIGAIFPDALHPSKTIWTAHPWWNAMLDSFSGLVIGAGFLWGVGFLVAALIFVRNKIRGIDAAPPEAMGMGDVHLLGMFGAMLGWKSALLAILFGVFLGATLGISKILWNKMQRARLGAKWTPPPPPTFDLPDGTDGDQPQGPLLWPLPVFGAVVLIAAICLNEQRTWLQNGRSAEILIPLFLLTAIGGLLVIAFPFYLYLKSINRLPGGEIVENDAGVKEEVYQGNYIPFGPSLAAGALIAALWDPLLRANAEWFFAGAQGPAPAAWAYHVAGEGWIASSLSFVLLNFNAATRWVMHLFGA